jgi:hypothetical protein
MRSKMILFSLFLIAAAGIPAAGAVAQDSAEATGPDSADPVAQESAGAVQTRVIYRREVFEYSRGGRVDPFRSLLGSVDLGVRPEDLALRVILANDDPRESVAIFTQSGANRRVSVRTGDRIGGMTVVAIHPRRVDVVIDDFGVPRRESFYVKKTPPETGTET